MNRIIRLIIIVLLFAAPSIASAQSEVQTLIALAKQAKNNGEFLKAIDYYETLLSKTKSDTYYNELVKLFIIEKDYESADKLIKKRIRKYPKKAELYIDRGYVYGLQNDTKSSTSNYNKALDLSGKDEQQSRTVAFHFNQYKLYEYVEKVYLKARKNQRNNRLFRIEIANAYAQQGKTTEMVEEYLSLLASNRSYLQTVQNILQRVINPDPDGTQSEKLKEQLIKRIQKNPNQEIFSELLIWLYIQDKNFNGAFIQAKALDRKRDEKGKRLFSLGELSLSNKAYEVAEKSYQYVISIGDDSPYFMRSKMKLVEVLKARITNSKTYTQEDLYKLKTAYETTINDLGRNSVTAPLLRGLAELNAYYLNQVDSGISILNEVILLNRLTKQEKAKAKIELADLYLLDSQIWEASLLYSQVEKAFKYDVLGETAKYKNAKVAFYTGDFYWAQAQLDVLKGSTSKLISNDAMALSLLITDNVGRDSIIEPLQFFARADLLIFRRDYEKAEKVLDSIPKYFPSTTLKDDVLFTKYKMAYELRDYEQAAKHLKELLADYAEDLLGDDALFALAQLEEEQFSNTEKAMEHYKTLLTTYPSSLFVVEARKRFRHLRGDQLEEKIN